MGSLDPTITPKVTEYIDKIIDYISNLIKLGAAYEVNGDVYFRVPKIKDYGCLSGISIEDLQVGARIEENSSKESPLDFTLWKKTDVGVKWNSPWGEGRPGWHTECCVMIDTIFNRVIDIHGGGYDLKFPHHENEIAQSEAMHHHKIANIWMHNAFININNEKMSKSLGNVIYAKDVVANFGGSVGRLIILSTHYRLPVSFTDDTIKAAQTEITKIQTAFKQLTLKIQTSGRSLEEGEPLYIENFVKALADDLNTSNAISELFQVIKETNNALRTKDIDLDKLVNLHKTLKDMFFVLGLDIPFVKLNEEDIALYNEYLAAKNNKDFAKSDDIRARLLERKIL
jgi:cysteinyl-tRNA synthetase